jgi:hypothetical protein
LLTLECPMSDMPYPDTPQLDIPVSPQPDLPIRV